MIGHVRRTEEIEPWLDSKLECGIGHVVSGRVRVVRHWRQGEYRDDEWLDAPADEYDPPRCIVCGLWINKRRAVADSRGTMSDKKPKETCPDCGGVRMGPIYWQDDVPAGTDKICRKGRVVFSGEDVDGWYRCDGSRFQMLTLTSGDVR